MILSTVDARMLDGGLEFMNEYITRCTARGWLAYSLRLYRYPTHRAGSFWSISGHRLFSISFTHVSTSMDQSKLNPSTIIDGFTLANAISQLLIFSYNIFISYFFISIIFTTDWKFIFFFSSRKFRFLPQRDGCEILKKIFFFIF